MKKMAGEPVGAAAGTKKEKRRGHQEARVVVHQFPFHSRPGLL
ncbi:hypothetical protein HU200_033471 [Digitaria exilis]|uniref:Uncharacterized protein n=1 Tax=Digitaria exilis TaxID=1010633 RepID=A0A835EPL0_9POAL|nr:hypothetical protein HU200_033471 [Digitaria exilis]